MNLFNLMPAIPQETRNLYYEAGVSSSKDFSRIETADTPYIESFEEVMARVREETSIAEHGVDPGAKPAEPDNGKDYKDYTDRNYTDRKDNAETPGRALDQSAEKPPVADERSGPEKPRTQAEKPDDKKRLSEDVFAAGPSLGMVRPDNTGQAAVEGVPEKGEDDAVIQAVTPDGEAGGITAADMAAPDAKADSVFSPEDGITFTDTYPLFENKPDVRGAGFEAPTDDVSGAAQDAEIMLANGNILDGDTAKQNRGAKDGFSEEVPEPEETRPFSFQVLPESDHQLVSLVNNTENGAQPENAAGKKKANSRKLNVEVVDMRSDSGAHMRGGEAKTNAMPVKDITVDVKGAPLVFDSLGDGRQTPAGFNQFDNAAAKSAAQLEGFLSRELQGGLNGDIVRQAAVMLRDGGEGLIRLQLHPESLGNVRIKLALSGNRVEGIITVESPEAMNAFERELAALAMAFRDSGFEGASLNMQMSGGNSGGDLFDGVQAGAFSQLIAASSYESSTVTVGGDAGSIYTHGGLSILA
jgi:hypothetical protein